MEGTCTTHGLVDNARPGPDGVYCRCNLLCADAPAVSEAEAGPCLADGLEPAQIDDLLAEASNGKGWYIFGDDKVHGRAAALRHVMEGDA